MRSYFFENIDEVDNYLEGKANNFLWFHSSNNYNTEEQNKISEILKKYNSIIGGGHFPHVLFKSKKYSDANILIEIKGDYRIDAFSNLANISLEDLDGVEKYQTGIALVDGLANNVENSLKEVFKFYGYKNVIGGGAGDISLQKLPVLFHNKEIHEDLLTIIWFEGIDTDISMEHGWEPMSDDMMVTSVDGKVIKEINNKPAFSFYKNFVENKYGELDWSDFFNAAKAYPFGLSRFQGLHIIRDLITNDGECIISLTEFELNSTFQIMHGDKSSLIKSLQKEKYSNLKDENVFIVDCISRVLFLGDDFEKELEPFENCNVFGFTSIGEILSNHNTFLEYLNKTCVIGIIK